MNLFFNNTNNSTMTSITKEEKEFIINTQYMATNKFSQEVYQVTIYWDWENCPVPSQYRGYEVVVALRNFALRYGFLCKITAIGNLEQLPKAQRNELQESGVSMHDVSSGKPSAADIAILVEILKLTLDTPAPHVIILITGDRDFSKLLHVLVGRGYRVVLLHNSSASPVLQSTASEHYLWSDFIKFGCPNVRANIQLSQAPPTSVPIQSEIESNATSSVLPSRPLITPRVGRFSLIQNPPHSVYKTSPTSKPTPSDTTFLPLLDYLEAEAKKGRLVITMCDLGATKAIPFRKHNYLKLKPYVEDAARLGHVTMIHLPNNQIAICLTEKSTLSIVRKIPKLIKSLPAILNEMKENFLAPVETNLHNLIKSHLNMRMNPHNWDLFMQCVSSCGYNVTGTAGKRTIIGPLGNFDGFDPSDPKHSLEGETLAEFDSFLNSSPIDSEGGFKWNVNLGRFGFVTDLLEYGPPRVKSCSRGILLSHIQILLNQGTLVYNERNRICRANVVGEQEQKREMRINIDLLREKLQTALSPHSTPLNPLLELQAVAPVVRDIWRPLGFVKMKQCLKVAEEHEILICEWNTGDHNEQPWVALSSSMDQFINIAKNQMKQMNVTEIDATWIKMTFEKLTGKSISIARWRPILLVASKHPHLNIKKKGQTYYVSIADPALKQNGESTKIVERSRSELIQEQKSETLLLTPPLTPPYNIESSEKRLYNSIENSKSSSEQREYSSSPEFDSLDALDNNFLSLTPDNFDYEESDDDEPPGFEKHSKKLNFYTNNISKSRTLEFYNQIASEYKKEKTPDQKGMNEITEDFLPNSGRTEDNLLGNDYQSMDSDNDEGNDKSYLKERTAERENCSIQ